MRSKTTRLWQASLQPNAEGGAGGDSSAGAPNASGNGVKVKLCIGESCAWPCGNPGAG